jgi:hypothetical protein
MGTYRQPDIIKDSMGVLRQAQTAEVVRQTGQKAFDREFAELNKQRVAEAKAVKKQLKDREKAVWKDQQKVNKELADSGLTGADQSSSTVQVIKEIKNMYYGCSGVHTDECAELQAYLMTLPDQIANGIGVQGSLQEEYEKIMKHPPGATNSLDADRVDVNNLNFGREFAENSGRNVVCKIDPKTKQIYWEIPDRTETHIEYEYDENGEIIGEEEVEIEVLGGRIYNDALVKTQLDPNNPVPFFPTHGDPSEITNIMHNGGGDGTSGIGTGLKGDILTVTAEGGEAGEDVEVETKELDTPELVNEELRRRLNNYDFTNTLNSSGAVKLYNNAVKTNINKLKGIENKSVEDFTITEQRLAETWYGGNWKTSANEDGTLKADENDAIKKYEEDGAAAFGPWLPLETETPNGTQQLQRAILSNSLRFNYEDEYLIKEPPKEEIIEEVEIKSGKHAEFDPRHPDYDPSKDYRGEVDITKEKEENLEELSSRLKPWEEKKKESNLVFTKPTEEVTKEVTEGVSEDVSTTITIDTPNVWEKYGFDKESWEKLGRDYQEKIIKRNPKGIEVATTDLEKETEKVGDYKYGGVDEKGKLQFTYTDSKGNTKNIPRGKMKNVPLKTNEGDGKDYLREMLNFENSMGDFDGNSVSNYGFSGAGGEGSKGGALLKEFKKAKGNTKAEKALATIDEYIIGGKPNDSKFRKVDEKTGDATYFVGGVKGNTTILQDLQMTRANFDKLPTAVKKELVDWKFNSGRNIRDLIKTANDKSSWSGVQAHQNISPTNDEIKNIKIGELTKKKLTEARHELYTGRIEGLKIMIGMNKSGPYKKALQKELKLAEKGYKNSQQYRR